MPTSATDLRIVLPGTPRPAPTGWVRLDLPRGCVVLTVAEFVEGLKRGRAWRRRQQLAQRLQAAEEGR